ncbi:MAG: DUF1647 domain-containing protein [Ekhidna sp.]|nr:DUF1647 domain-containing protein [Ekhidna sp.]
MHKQTNHIISAADEAYFKNLKQLIYSYNREKEYLNSKFIIYDIGMSNAQVDEMEKLSSLESDKFSFKRFDFRLYPEFVKPKYRTYSWKPILIAETADKIRGNFLWMDSANYILNSLTPVWNEIENTCSYAPISGSGTLEEWTLQATLDYLEVPDHFYHKPNRAGNTFGFSMKCGEIEKLIHNWKKLSLIKECIKPEGANRYNHKDDQSLLTILLLKLEDQNRIKLTDEKVNISTSKPAKSISVRNKFPSLVDLKVGALPHYYFKANRALDIFVNKITGN